VSEIKIKSCLLQIVVLAFFLAKSINVNAQIDLPNGNFANSIITISGRVNEEGRELQNVNVSLQKNRITVNEISTDEIGGFSFTLKSDNQYILVFSKSGYVSKKILVNTENVPINTSVVRSGIDVELFKEIDGVDFSILNQPIGEFFYSPNKKNLDYDKEYTNSIREKLDALQNAISNRQRQINEEQKNQKKYTVQQLDSIIEKRKEDQNKKKGTETKFLRGEETVKLNPVKIKDISEVDVQSDKVNWQKNIGANAEKNRTTAKKEIEKKKIEEKEKLVRDSARTEEIKLKIKNNPSQNAITKNDTIYEMNEADAKAVFDQKLSKEEFNLMLKELSKKYPEGYTTIVRNYPNFKITTIIKVFNAKADELKIIEYNFARFYKKNNDDITEAVFREETSGLKLNLDK
ncbi:MAG: carboxypeptidase-like regulatory domain-containing protein, partial [Bacteroidota bacterium]